MDQYQVKISKSAKKEFKLIDKQFHQRIFNVIYDLRNNPIPSGSLRLTNSEFYRVRIGDYRVIYSLDLVTKIVIITKVRHRKDAY